MKRKSIKDKKALFLSNKGNRLSYQQIRKMFTIAMQGLSIPGSPHYLRHTMITQKLIEGAPVIGVSRLVGHSTPYTTYKSYSHVSERLLEKISYNNLFNDQQQLF